ncbi:MAG: gluconate 2-dehydrogenase gamma chain [Pseudohongiellaceae bacterium]|jgi:gluconate 2-dehydrogenase gamma chain
MVSKSISRRSFLKSTGVLAKGSFIVLTTPALLAACQRAEENLSSSEPTFKTLNNIEGKELRAIAARIIPTDETPGAEEAGVIYFIDAVLSDDREDEYARVRLALREIQAMSAVKFNAAYFSDMTAPQQDEVLTEMETTSFFATVRYLTIAGMFSLPEYGGNKDKIGYQLIGFNDAHAWAPPYGFYDADYAEKGE